MKKIECNSTCHIQKYIISILAFWFLWLLLEFLYIRLSPHQYYIDVYSVEPVYREYAHWEKPRFATTSSYKKKWKYERSDIEYCRRSEEEQYSYYSNYVSETHKQSPDEVQGWQWRYNIEWPKYDAECYLFSTTTYYATYGIRKSDSVISWPYKYVLDPIN
jgi:hypothetical protein